MKNVVHLTAAGVSLLLDCRGPGLPAIVHWGSPIEEPLADLALATAPQPIGFSADTPVRVSLLPEQSAGWLGFPGLAGHRDGRSWSSAFAVTGVQREERGTGRDSADAVVVSAHDDQAGLALRLEIELHRSGVLRTRAGLTSTRPGRYWLDHLTLLLPVPGETTELLDFTGHHLRERSPQRTAFTHGIRARENRTGRTGYDAAHVLCAGTTGFANRRGQVWGVHTAFSGNARTLAERTFHGHSALGGGELLLPGEVGLEFGETYTGPWVYGSYGAEGLDELSGRFHEFLRSRPHHPAGPRPVVANTWEAVYFDHDLDRLTRLARAAAAAGAERFVLDDGWFGSRRNDTSDWATGSSPPTSGRPAWARSSTSCTSSAWTSACG